MPTITAKDGAKIFTKDWGTGQPVVIRHGWPLNADLLDFARQRPMVTAPARGGAAEVTPLAAHSS